MFSYLAVLLFTDAGKIALAIPYFLVELLITGEKLFSLIGKESFLGGLGKPVADSIVLAGAITGSMSAEMAYIEGFVSLGSGGEGRCVLIIIHIE